jgi:hypothetical protein
LVIDSVELEQNDYTKVLKLDGENIDSQSIKALLFEETTTPLIMGFVSPHLDFNSIVLNIKRHIPTSTKLILSTTAGELCSFSQNSGGKVYLDAESSWSDIVLESFSGSIISKLESITIPLAPKEITNPDKIVNYIEDEISQVNLSFLIEHTNTIGITLIDGLSAQESFFMEAVYNSGKFPCLLVGGSSGGKLDFQTTYIYDGNQVVQNSAIVTFVKLQPKIRYGIFKSQNFQPTSKSFILLEANEQQRYAQTVLNPKTLEMDSFITALTKEFKCKKEQLEEYFRDYTFAIKIGKEYFIRSVASFDLDRDIVTFFCDISFADELILMKKSGFIEQTDRDFDKFMQNKSGKVVGALLNDCILRRLNNENELKMLKTFDNIPLIGFSTFGELLGVNINQTLTSIIFFENNGEVFKDYYVDNFVSNYSNFKSYFMIKKIKQLNIVLEIKNQLIQKIISSIPLIRQTLISLKESIENSYDVEKKVTDILDNMVNYMDEINQNTNNTKSIFENIGNLQKDIKLIKDSTKSNATITKQSRILALNASVESVKAGEHGLRFAVIAKELDRLSESTKERLDTTVKAVSNMGNNIQTTSEKVHNSSLHLDKIIENSTFITSDMENISTIMHTTTSRLQSELSHTTKLLEDIEIISNLESKMKKIDNLGI